MSGKERAIQSIREKLHFARIRPETLVHLCEKEDKNNDDLLSTHDLEDVLKDTLGKCFLFHYICSIVSFRRALHSPRFVV